jgi:hypothetical protein
VNCIVAAVSLHDIGESSRIPAAGFVHDSEADAVERRVGFRRRALHITEMAPRPMRLPLDPEELQDDPEDVEPSLRDLGRVLLLAIKRDFERHAAELAAIETVLAEIADVEFDGRWPLDDAPQAIVDETHAIVEDIREELSEFLGEVDWPQPSDEDRDLVWALVRKAAA